MKLRHLFLAAIVAIGMMACNNEDVPQVVDGAEATLSIKVMPVSSGAKTKVVTDLSDADATNTPGLTEESLIQQLEVYVFNAITEQLVKYESASATEATVGINEVNDIVVVPGATKIYIVANANLGTQATITALEGASKDLMVVAANALPMSGNSGVVTILPGYNFYGYSQTAIDNSAKTGAAINTTDLNGGSPLTIERIVARVAIVEASLNITDATQQLIFDDLKDVEVAMFNVSKASKLFGAAGTLAANANYLFGEEWPTTQNSYVFAAANEEPSLKDALTNPTAPAKFSITSVAAPTFYVTENTATATNPAKEQMLIVLRGKPTLSGNAVTSEGLYTDADGYTYYPVWVNGNDANYTYSGANTGDNKIRRNTQYNITLTITGIGNPSIDEVEKAWLDVKVNVKEWVVVNQGVIW